MINYITGPLNVVECNYLLVFHIFTIALKSPGGAPSAFCEVGVQEEFGHNLVRCGLMLTDLMGQPLFALVLTCVRFVSRDFLSLEGGPSTNSNCFHWFSNKIEGHNQSLQRNPCRFKTWMKFVRQILIKMEMSSIKGFPRSSFEVLCGVINANTAVATQWPLKHAQQMIRAVWYCGPVAHCSYLRYTPFWLRQ